MEERKEWVDDVFYDNEKGQLNFLLARDFLENYEKNKNDFSITKINESEIESRVIERTNKLNYEIDQKNYEIIDLEEDKDELQTEHNKLSEENRSLKDSRDEEIKKEVEIRLDGKNEIIELLRNQLSQNEVIETKLSDLTENLNQHKSSYEKGVEGEMDMLSILQGGYWDEVDTVSKKDHAGDFILKTNNKKFIVDVKNYTGHVPAKEVRKLAKDIETNKCDGGAIISLKSGIYNPNRNILTKEVIDHILVSGKSILLLSNAYSLPSEYINSNLKLLNNNPFSDNSLGKINDKYKVEIANSIIKMKNEIDSEKKSFQNMITKKQNDLENLENTLIEMIGPMNNFVCENDNSKPKKLNASSMRKKLKENGISTENLKGKSLKDKYNEIVS